MSMMIKGMHQWMDYLSEQLAMRREEHPWGTRYVIPPENGHGYIDQMDRAGMWTVFVTDIVMNKAMQVLYTQEEPYYMSFSSRELGTVGKFQDASYPNDEVIDFKSEVGSSMKGGGVFYFTSYFDQLTSQDVMGFIDSIRSYDDEALMKQIHPLLKQIEEYSGRGLSRRLFAESRVVELASLLIRITEEEQRGEKIILTAYDSSQLYRVLDILKERMIDPPGIAELARMTTLNEFKMKAGFRQLFGTTIFEYLRLLRMEAAADLLVDPHCSAAAVGQQVGYHTAHGFANAFRKYYGMTPVQWQMTKQEKSD